MPYLLYARKSQESEERQIQSIDDQLHRCREFAKSQGLSILDEITESKSAKEPYQRPGFARLLSMIEKGHVGSKKIEGILAWHPDRLSRNEVDAAALTYLIRKGKLRDLKFVTYSFDNSPEGMMMLQMALSQSQYYSSKLARDVKRGMQSKAEKGWCPHHAPEGYKNDVATRTVIADPDRFEVVRRAWDLMLRETHTVREVVNTMNDQWGYLTRKTPKRGGGPLSLSAAYLMFHSPYYTGYFVEKGITYKGMHPPMVSAKEFSLVQNYLAREGRQQPKKHTYAYTGFIRCFQCGCLVTAEMKTGRRGVGRYVYYHCTGRRGGCDRSSIREDVLEAQIESHLSRLTLDQDVVECALSVIRRWQRGQFGDEEQLHVQQRTAKVEAERQLDALLTLKLRGMISDDLFQQKQHVLEGQISQLEEGLNQTEDELVRARTSAINAMRFLGGAHEKFLVGSVYEKREIAQALGLSYRFDQGVVTIEQHPALMPHLLLEMLPQLSSATSSGVASSVAAATTRSAKQISRRSKTGLAGTASLLERPKLRGFETAKIGSGSNKKAAFTATVSFGSADGTRSETEHQDAAQMVSAQADKRNAELYDFFRDRPAFRAVSCVS